MRSLPLFFAALLIGLMPCLAQAADDTSALTPAQKAAVEATVRELLTQKEPELIIKAAKTAQERMDKEATAKEMDAIKKNQQKLTNDPDSPVGGNPKGDVTIVEFFDYSCGYCKMAQAFIEKLMDEDKNIRFVYKEFPILGDGSVEASKVALASVAQGKYIAFHNALMKSKEHPNTEVALKIAKEVGLDVEKLKKDMASEKVQKILDANHELAMTLGARGTPAIFIGDKRYDGALPYEQLKKLVAEARKK